MTVNNPWIITNGTLTYSGPHGFIAQWQQGRAGLEGISGSLWYDEASGGEDDTLVLYGFEWEAGPPDQESFESLM